MEPNFWINRWQTNQIGFHLPEANPLLVKYFSELKLTKNARVFIPLCGKTLDIAWLLAQGYQVVGCELVEMAIVQLFEELKIKPAVKELGKLKRYSAPGLDILVGDIFDLTKETLGTVDAIYDRAALVALPDDMRVKYVAQLKHLAPQLLITFEYDQNLVSGPPFSIDAKIVQQYYPHARLLESNELPGGLKGLYPAKESIWLIGAT